MTCWAWLLGAISYLQMAPSHFPGQRLPDGLAADRLSEGTAHGPANGLNGISARALSSYVHPNNDANLGNSYKLQGR